MDDTNTWAGEEALGTICGTLVTSNSPRILLGCLAREIVKLRKRVKKLEEDAVILAEEKLTP